MIIAGPEQRAAIDVSLFNTSRKVVDRTEQLTRTLLGRHPDLIVANVIDQIVRREVAISLQQFGETVLARREHYFINRDAGIAAYLTKTGHEKAVELCERFGHPIPYNQICPVTEILWELSLPQGGFVASGGAMQFFQEVSSQWAREGGASKGFILLYDQVVRIESGESRLWQNWDYNWDGTPKPARP